MIASDGKEASKQAVIEEDNRLKGPFRYRILLVDDEPELRRMLRGALETRGYEVHTACDGFDALAALKQALPDVIISDLRMPNMSGFEFLGIVRRRFPNIAVIATSGEFSVENVPESVLADVFLEKGHYSYSELSEKLESLIKQVPPRPRGGRPPNAPIWVPVHGNTNYVAVTCPDCLRTFPVATPLLAGVHNVNCDFCASPVTFHLSGDVKARAA